MFVRNKPSIVFAAVALCAVCLFVWQTDDAWNTTMWEGPHRLTLARRDGAWSIADDFAVGTDVGDVAAALKAGGAPPAIWRAEARRIARGGISASKA